MSHSLHQSNRSHVTLERDGGYRQKIRCAFWSSLTFITTLRVSGSSERKSRTLSMRSQSQVTLEVSDPPRFSAFSGPFIVLSLTYTGTGIIDYLARSILGQIVTLSTSAP